jgi:hypothetical protein
MGLEAVEIIIETEELFGIAIPDDVASGMGTPADLVAYVVSAVPTFSTSECLTQRLFYRLRRGFRLQLPFESRRFEPDTKIAALLHDDQWPRVWREVRSSVGDPHWPESIPWPGFLRDGPRTMRQLIWHLAAALPKPAAGEAWSRQRIEAEVRRIVGEALGKKDFRLSARFTGELGLS